MKHRCLLGFALIALAAASVGAEEPADAPAPNTPRSEESLTLPATTLTAAQGAAGGSSDGWRVTWAPAYIWFSGFSGTVGAGTRTASVDAGFWDLADHLNFAWATVLDVGKGRFGVVTDIQYIHLEDDQTFSGPPPPLFSGVEVDSKLFMLDPEFYVRAVDNDRGSFDLLAGIRYWHLDNDLNFQAGVLPATRVNSGDDWVDPILGFRFRVNLDPDKKWFIPAKADIGGFDAGADLTWQVYAGIGRKLQLFGHPSAIIVGYRKIFVDRDTDGKLLKVSLSGPIFGTTISFGRQ